MVHTHGMVWMSFVIGSQSPIQIVQKVDFVEFKNLTRRYIYRLITVVGRHDSLRRTLKVHSLCKEIFLLSRGQIEILMETLSLRLRILSLWTDVRRSEFELSNCLAKSWEKILDLLNEFEISLQILRTR